MCCTFHVFFVCCYRSAFVTCATNTYLLTYLGLLFLCVFWLCMPACMRTYINSSLRSDAEYQFHTTSPQCARADSLQQHQRFQPRMEHHQHPADQLIPYWPTRRERHPSTSYQHQQPVGQPASSGSYNCAGAGCDTSLWAVHIARWCALKR